MQYEVAVLLDLKKTFTFGYLNFFLLNDADAENRLCVRVRWL